MAPNTRRKDLAWEHVDYQDPVHKDPLKILCKYCNKRTDSGVHRMKYHLAKIPGHDIAGCPNVPVIVQQEIRTYLMRKEESKEKRKTLKNSQHQTKREKTGRSRTMGRPRGTTITVFENNINSKSMEAGKESAVGSSAPLQEDDPVSPSAYSHPLCFGLHLAGPSGEQTNHPSCNLKQDHVQQTHKVWAQVFYAHGLPLHIFNSPLFQRACKMTAECGPGNYTPPSYHHAKTFLLQECKDEINESMAEKKKVWDKSGCSIMCDLWTDGRNKTLLNIMVGSLNGSMFLKAINASGKVKDHQYLFEVLKESIEEVGSSKVVQVVTYNSTAFREAGKMLMCHYKRLYWTPCAAHCIDCILKDFAKLSWVSEVIEKAKFVSKFIYTHHIVHDLFIKYSNGKEILTPGTTQFATHFILLESMIEHRPELMHTFNCSIWRDDKKFHALRKLDEANVTISIVYDMVETAGKFWYEAKNAVEIAKPLVKILEMVDGDKPSIAYIYDAMSRAKTTIISYLEEIKLGHRYPTISSIIDERWNNQLHNPLHSAAHILNPLFGFGNLLDQRTDVKIKANLEEALDKIVYDLETRLAIILQLEKYKTKTGTQFNRPVVDKARDLLRPEQWWENYGIDTLELKDVAIRIISQPCSAWVSKCDWSVFEHIHFDKHGRLTSQRLNDLVFVSYNLKAKLMEQERLSYNGLDIEDIHPFLPIAEWLDDEPVNVDDQVKQLEPKDEAPESPGDLPLSIVLTQSLP